MEGMRRRSCELCNHTARIYCESDKASLCYDCDQSVHSANFLVAKHSRTLLCHRCQSPTPWVASGLNLGRAASLCLNCVHQCTSKLHDEKRRRRNAEEICSANSYDDVDEDEDEVCETDGEDEECSQTDDNVDDDEEDEEDAENQVVPWSSLASTPAAAPPSFSSSKFSSEYFSSAANRKRDEDANLYSEDDAGSSSERFSGEARTETDDESFGTSNVIRSKRVRY